MHRQASEITRLLNAWCQGDQDALEELAPLVESELRRLARAYLRKEGAGNTLQPTALINEAYLHLIEWEAVEWQNRAHFFAVAAKVMRRVLVNRIARRRQKRGGGGAVLISLAEAGEMADRTTDVVDLDEALKSLASFDDRKSRVVELRFFGGLNAEETAEVLGISSRTVHREWDLARAWLFRELRPKGDKESVAEN